MLPHDIKRSFTITNKQVEDTYLRYTHFRTLHYKYYTNDVLTKCKILTDNTCSQCENHVDSNYHMLFRLYLYSPIMDRCGTMDKNYR